MKMVKLEQQKKGKPAIAFLFFTLFSNTRYQLQTGTSGRLDWRQQEKIINNKLNDKELLQLFHKVQQLNKEDITSVKAMLKAFVFQKDLLKQLE